MPIRVTVKSRSSGSILRKIKAAQRAQVNGVSRVHVGFFDESKYDNGTPVPNVAAWNEFGTESRKGNTQSPPRPFMRNSNRRMKPRVKKFLRERVDPHTMVVTRQLAGQVGTLLVNDVKRSIVELRNPPLAESTIKKKGSTNPLIDDGVMKDSTTYKVIK